MMLSNSLRENLGAIGPNGFAQLTEWNMFDQNASASFFDPEWMFGVKEGFDVVIGNPPYVRRTKLPVADKVRYEKIYKSADKQYDLYLLFIEKGLKSLVKNGYLCYINPIRFFNADYGEQCRRFIVGSHSISTILDVSQLPVFDASTYPCVLLIENTKRSQNSIKYYKPSSLDNILPLSDTEELILQQEDFEVDDCKFIFSSDRTETQIISKIDLTKTSIGDFFNVARGLPNNKVDFNENKYWAVKSTCVRRYYFSGEEVPINTSEAEKFTSEMVILPRTVLFLQAMLKRKNLVVLDRIYYLTPISSSLNNMYVLGVLNSKLINFWFEYHFSSTKVRGGYFDLNGKQIKSIPIKPNKDYEQKIAGLVSIILKKKEDNPIEVTAEEQRIDHLVYHLYGLTYDEVLVIDPETPITREEYDNYKETK